MSLPPAIHSIAAAIKPPLTHPPTKVQNLRVEFLMFKDLEGKNPASTKN